MQIVLTFDPACKVDERTAAFVAAALDAQAAEFCTKWNLPPVPVNYYSTDVLLGLEGEELAKFTADSYMVTVQTTIDVANALGYHDDVLGTIFARVLWQVDATWATISHEILELLGDLTCDIYVSKGNGTEQAKEACDRVEEDSYPCVGTIGDDSMTFALSNYLLLSAFEPNSQGPWDRMGTLKTWDGLTPGGYEIVRDAAGNETEIDASRASVRVVPGSEAAHATIAAKRARSDSRLVRRLAIARAAA